MSSNLLFLGTKAHVAAIDKATGTTVWQTKLKGGLTSGDSFVSLLVQDGRVYAHTHGELFCLDESTGSILWKNDLSGLGYGLATLACNGASNSSAQLVTAAQKLKAAQAATAGAAGAAATSGR